jgi:hypothetical protein
MEGKKKECKCDNNCACGKEEKDEAEEKGEVKEAKKMKGEDPCWKDYKMVGTKKGKGGKEVPNCVPEETEVKNEAYNEKAVDKAISSSRQKIGGREAKKIHALLKGSTGYKSNKNAEETKKTFPNVKHLTKDGHPDWKKHGMGEEVELDEGEEKGGGYNAPKAKGAMTYKKVLGQHTVGNRSFPTEIEAMNYIQKNQGEAPKKKTYSYNEESEQIDELSKKTLGSYVVKSLAPSSEKSVSNLASKGGYKLGQAQDDDYTAGEKEDAKSVKRSLGVLTAVRKMTKEEAIDEAKAESPIKGTRLISKHEGKDGHHAEVRHNSEYNEFQVHHYENGKHMGEGPVSYHDTKADAKEAAEYEVKNYRPKNGSLRKEEVELDEKHIVKYAMKSPKTGGKIYAAHYDSKEDAEKFLHSIKKDGGNGIISSVKEEVELAEKLIGKQHKLDKNKNGKLDKHDFKLLRKEETIEEKLNPSMGASKWVQDFVKSKDPRFEGKTKKERIKMALGAYYGAKNESVETEEVDTIDEAYGDKRDYKKHHISVDGKYVATTTWARDAKEAEEKFAEQHPKYKNARITVVKER